MAHVAFSAPARVAAPDLAAQVTRRFPSLATSAQAIEAEGRADAKGGYLLAVGPDSLIVMFIDAPLPGDVFADDAYQRLWPGWRDAARMQKAHAIVANLQSAKDTAEAVRAAALVMQAAAAIVELSPDALGVSWAASELFVAPDEFRVAARRIPHAGLPLDRLVKPRWYPGPAPARRPGFVTLGLAPFVGREIEHPPNGEDPAETFGRALGLATYLLQKGPVVADGDTIGRSERERIRVRLGERNGTATYRLEFERA